MADLHRPGDERLDRATVVDNDDDAVGDLVRLVQVLA